MIKPMTQYTFVVFHKDVPEFLKNVQDLGVVDIRRSTKAADATSKELFENIASLKSLLKTLQSSKKEAVKKALTIATVTADTRVMGASDWTRWYVAKGNVTVDGRITVTGNVHFILSDGASLTINGGIYVPSGSSLTIYGHSIDRSVMGQLLAQNAGTEQAGIGGNSSESNGAIVINGGKVTSYGGERGAGIGGGGADDANAPAAGSITVNGSRMPEPRRP